MKNKKAKKQNSFEEDHYKIIKDFQKVDSPFTQDPQWNNPGDFIVKFSLYQETPNSITSTDTAVNIGVL
jgi:hypothetical protein